MNSRNAFSRQTIAKFEDAAASIPLRPLNRAFDEAGIRPGEDPGGAAGSRKEQFRRYIAGVDQRDPRQRDQLGDALGALIDEVATSKVDFLVKAAESDGFAFADGTFRPVDNTANSFTVARIDDVAQIEEHARRLLVIADESPGDAVDGAMVLVTSVCRTVLRLRGKPALDDAADLAAIVNKATSAALELTSISAGRSKKRAGRSKNDADGSKGDAGASGRIVQHLSSVVDGIVELRARKGLSRRDARLAVDAAVAIARFVAEAHAEGRPDDTDRR